MKTKAQQVKKEKHAIRRNKCKRIIEVKGTTIREATRGKNKQLTAYEEATRWTEEKRRGGCNKKFPKKEDIKLG